MAQQEVQHKAHARTTTVVDSEVAEWLVATGDYKAVGDPIDDSPRDVAEAVEPADEPATSGRRR